MTPVLATSAYPRGRRSVAYTCFLRTTGTSMWAEQSDPSACECEASSGQIQVQRHSRG